MLEILGLWFKKNLYIDSVEFLFQNLRTFLFFFLLNFFNYFISLFTLKDKKFSTFGFYCWSLFLALSR